MVTETLQVNILAKIRDFEKKMGVVDKKINSMQKGSIAASKTVDKMLSTKATGTTAAVDLVNKKLAQVNRTAASTKKALSGKMMFSADSSGIDLQKVKLDQLKQKYADLTSGVRAPASLKTAEKDLAAVAQQLTDADAKAAKLYTELQRLQGLQSGSKDIGNTKGVARYQVQIDAVQREMDALAASTDTAATKVFSLNAKMEALRMNPSASPEAQLLAAQIKAADAKMEKLGTDTTTTTKKITGIRSGGGALDAINRKISNLERSSARTARSVTALGRRFLVLFTGKLISMAFNGLQDGLTGASTKSDQLKSSLDTLSSAGRTISNSVVAALAPLINVAAPMIDYISQKIMDFGNSVAMFFASISGQSTVLQATKAYQDYGSAAKDAGDDAAAGAEKARNALAGFDQITKLDTSTSSSRPGSPGAPDNGTTSYITVPVVQSELAKKVSDAIEKLKGPLSDFYETVLKPIGEWIMGPGVDFLAAALTTVADFVDEHPTLTGVLLGIVGALVALKAVGAIGLAVNATITGLGALGQLFGLGGAGTVLAAGGITIAGALTLATLTVASMVVLGALSVSEWDKAPPEEKKTVIDEASSSPNGYMPKTSEIIIDSLKDGNLLKALGAWGESFSSFANSAPARQVAIAAAKYPDINPFFGMPTSDAEITIESSAKFLQDAVNKGVQGVKDSYGGMPSAIQAAMKESQKKLENGTRDQSRTYQDYLYGLTTKTGSAFNTVKTTVDLGTKDAARYMNSNIGTGVQGVKDSFGGMPSAIQTLLTGLNNTVWGGMNTVSGTLAERTAGGVNTALGSYSGMPSAVQTEMNNLNSAVWSGATLASSLLTSNTHAGVTTALGSYSGMPSTIQAHMQTLVNNVSSKATEAGTALYDNSQAGINKTVPSWSTFSNDGTRKITTFAENVRLAMEAVLKNMSKLPSSAAEARGFAGLTSGFLEGIHNLPMFAQGGVVNSATAAIIGESGKEVVMPLERNTGWIDKLADKINSRGGGGGDIYLTVQNVMDGRVISEKVTKIKKRDAVRSNKPAFA